MFEKVYPTGSKHATIYGLPKTHEILWNDFHEVSFLPISSSIATYNYNLAKFCSELLDSVIPNEHCVKDSFSFSEEI